MEYGYVYLIVEGDHNGDEKYKIGVTKNDPDKRLKKLKTGNSNQLEVLKLYRSSNYKKVEKLLHRKFKNQKTLSDNEFFYLNDDQVFGFIKSCEEAESIIVSLKDNPFFK